MKKKIIPALLIIGIGIGIFGWRSRSNTLVLRGEVEGTIYPQIAEVQGKIVEMNIDLGSQVKRGELIARLDDTDQKYALEQLQIVLEKKRLALAVLQKGTKQEELEKARRDVSIAGANFHTAEATHKNARDDAEAMAKLYEAGGLAKSELDKVKLKETASADALEAARNQTVKAREQLSMLLKGTDEEIIAMAEIDITEIESRIRQMQETLDKYRISASCVGTVISKNYVTGSIVNPGYNLADISADKEKYVICYVPKEDSMRISYGQLFTVRFNGTECQGELRFIDVKSQYTPKDMQTSAMKNKVSVKIKLLLPADTTLKPGNAVEVVIESRE